MYFVGVSTTRSSIMRVFPEWARHLGIDARIEGIDLPLHAPAADYRAAVEKVSRAAGALVTTHKLDLFHAARDLFDEVGEEAALLGEVSSISKRDGRLIGHARDPLTSGLALEAIRDEWDGEELLLLGAGGSSLALTLYLHRRAGTVPSRIVVTNRSAGRLEEMRAIHERIGFSIPIEYHPAADNDALVASMAPGSIIANATGLGKDAPGSPLTDAVRFPPDSIAWDFNYRGDLLFLRQAADVETVDGWVYFLHGWTRVIADVFDLDIPTSGPEFEALSDIALNTTKEPA
jgi:shikimate 5-dehydrogenase